ncbi:MAG: GEVED domain-containing protein, partial [Flavobacteriales bacterium]
FEQNGKHKRTGSFVVPLSAESGDYRLRVSMRWKGYSNSCGTFKNGEVEDYTIRINQND